MSEASHVQMPDGRRMAFREYGARMGRVLLLCHGTPGSRLGVTPAMADQAGATGVRLIVPDRPGYGLSDQFAGRALLDWPRDAATLMDALGAERFDVLGYSSGSIYALACARALRERVTSVILAGAMAPNLLMPEASAFMSPAVRDALRLAHDDSEALAGALAPLARDPDQLFALVTSSVAPVDLPVFTQPEVADAFRRDCRESVAQGAGGMVWDYALATGDWGFNLDEVLRPVAIWQGLADINTPAAMAEYLAERLPRCKLHRLPGVGHLCLFSHWGKLLTSLDGAMPGIN